MSKYKLVKLKSKIRNEKKRASSLDLCCSRFFTRLIFSDSYSNNRVIGSHLGLGNYAQNKVWRKSWIRLFLNEHRIPRLLREKKSNTTIFIEKTRSLFLKKVNKTDSEKKAERDESWNEKNGRDHLRRITDGNKPWRGRQSHLIES